MYCTNCGSENESKNQFCPNCGKPLHNQQIINNSPPVINTNNINTKLNNNFSTQNTYRTNYQANNLNKPNQNNHLACNTIRYIFGIFFIITGCTVNIEKFDPATIGLILIGFFITQ
jgi:hypothetical protein